MGRHPNNEHCMGQAYDRSGPFRSRPYQAKRPTDLQPTQVFGYGSAMLTTRHKRRGKLHGHGGTDLEGSGHYWTCPAVMDKVPAVTKR